MRDDGLHHVRQLSLVWRGCCSASWGRALAQTLGSSCCGASDRFLRENDPKSSSKEKTAPAVITTVHTTSNIRVFCCFVLSRRYPLCCLSVVAAVHDDGDLISISPSNLTRTGKLAYQSTLTTTHYCRSKGRDGHKHGHYLTLEPRQPEHHPTLCAMVVGTSLSGLASTLLCTGQFLLPMFRCNESCKARETTTQLAPLVQPLSLDELGQDLWIVLWWRAVKEKSQVEAKTRQRD